MATRNERVVLSLEDNFTTPMARAAAATAALNKSLKDVDGTAVDSTKSTKTLGNETEAAGKKTEGATKRTKEYTLELALADEKSARLKKSLRDQAKAQLDAADGAAVFTKEIGGNGREIDRLSGRLGILRDAALTLGPALVPLGGAAVTGVAGLAAQFGALAGGVGVAVAALNGVGEAVEAVNEYQLDPTRENLIKVQEEFQKIGPAASEFVVFLQSIEPQLRGLQMTAREGFLPGLQTGIEEFIERGGQLNNIVGDLSLALGDLSQSAGEALGGERFDKFFGYLDAEAGPLLMNLGRSIGYVTEALGNLMVGMSPASTDFSVGMERMARSFAEWSRSLDSNQGFQDFVAYLRSSGPQVIDFLGSLTEMMAAVVQAAAPVGSALLPVLTQLADVLGMIASSPIGTPLLTAAAAMVTLNRATSLTSRSMQMLGVSTDMTAASMGRAAAKAGVWALAAQGIAEIVNGLGDLDRHIDASTASLETFNDVQNALANSNLGKYADQLGIDMQRLTADLAENGRQGEYVQETLARLGDEGGAFSTLIDSAGIGQEVLGTFGISLGKQADEANKAGTALSNLADRYDEGGRQAAGSADDAEDAAQAHAELAGDVDTAGASLSRLQGRLQKARAELKESRGAARDVAQTFVNLGDSLNNAEVSLGDWIAELERNAKALQNFQRNAQQAAKRGLDDGLIKSLRSAGQEGALRMKQLANATDSEIDRANGAWRRGEGAVKDFTKTVGGVPDSKMTKLEARVDEAMADLARLEARLRGIPDEQVNVWVTTRKAGGSPGFGPVEGFAAGGAVPTDRPAALPAAFTTTGA
ncbi:hypothetical protein ABKW28_10755 [Nocardioides sp. 31GB23]|uniref:hypothetical protein n=1 Tax=Nocardioides sp. 31GB23 TaxID=3156065 RepID=UPI0032AFFB00